MPDSRALQGKTVLVTGGSQGIGKAAAHRLAAAGAIVFAASIDAPDAPLEGASAVAGEVIPVWVDVREEASVKKLFRFVESRGGGIDALVHCAGVGVFKPLRDLSREDWDLALTTNLTGAFLCSREAIGQLLARGGGRIVHLGSVADHTPLPANGAYGCAKAGVRMLTQILNEEHKQDGIRATLLSLGAVYTAAWSARPEFSPSDMLSVEDVAHTILDILTRPAHVRIDHVVMLPPKGVL